MTLLAIEDRSRWGQRRIIPASEWVVGQFIEVLSWNNQVRPTTPAGTVLAPQVRTFALAVEYKTQSVAYQGLLRWFLDIGAGGARSRFKVDAEAVQHLSMVADTWTIGVVTENPRYFAGISDASAVPDEEITASVYVGDGESPGLQSTYTEPFKITSADSQLIMPIPLGARAFRLIGTKTNAGPFQTTVTFSIYGGPVGFVYSGLELEDLSRTGYVPLPAGATFRGLQIDNLTGGTVSGGVQFQLDI